jgi:hypothetical protein
MLESITGSTIATLRVFALEVVLLKLRFGPDAVCDNVRSVGLPSFAAQDPYVIFEGDYLSATTIAFADVVAITCWSSAR